MTIFRMLKAWLKSKALWLSYRICMTAAHPSLRERSGAVLILPGADGWDGRDLYGFGDEMLMLGLLDGLDGKVPGEITVLSMTGRGCRQISFYGHRLNVVSFSSGWFGLSSYKEFIKVASGAGRFIVIGADVLDGAYGAMDTIQRLRFLAIAVQMGIETAITGCSFNGTSNKDILRLLTHLDRAGTAIHARESVSLARMGFLQNARMAADLAFNVDVKQYPMMPSVEVVMDRARQWRKDGGVVLGVNMCGWNIKSSNFFNAFAQLLTEMASRYKLAVTFISHDTRNGNVSDTATLNKFMAALGDSIKVISAPHEIKNGIDAKHVVGCCDLLLTGRMHLAIAAHDQGVPAVSFGYQGKFEGFYAWFGMGNEWLVDYNDPAGAALTLSRALEQRAELSEMICEHIDAVRASARHNFDWIHKNQKD